MKTVKFPTNAPVAIISYSEKDIDILNAQLERRKQQLAIIKQVKELEVRLKEVDDEINDILKNKTVDNS